MKAQGLLHTTPRYTLAELKALAVCFYGQRRSGWAYDVFEFINATYFAGGLPPPLIVWELTSYSRFLGLTHLPSPKHDAVIVLHPSILSPHREPIELDEPKVWSYPKDWMGRPFAFDVLLHETIHLGGAHDHDSAEWISECNRLAPLLGLREFKASRSRPRRVDGKVRRVVDDGAAPYKFTTEFPQGAREYLGTADAYYRRGVSPFDEAGTGNTQLYVTGESKS